MEANPRMLDADASHQVSHNLRHMVDEIDSYLKVAADNGDQRIAAARERMAAQIHQMRQQIDELNDATLARVKRAAQQADATVQAHPYGAMSIAAATGLLVGFLAARR